jgi:hypothetical protein|tara:strand:+ start:79 stop:504 length:426 start_codon:yes stop_codon:yes gene_type:complete
MHKTLKKVENERLADMVQNIIKRMSKEEIGISINEEMKNLNPKFRNRDFIKNLNDIMLDFDSFVPPIGKNAGKIALSVVTVGGSYKGFSNYVKNKYVKKGTKVTSKDVDALFFIHVYDYALIAHDSKQFRKQIGIRKGFFG